MKNKKNIKGLTIFALILLATLSFNSCSKDDSPDYKSVRTDIYTLNPTFTYGSVVLGSGYSNFTWNKSWTSEDNYFNVYISQNGIIRDLGKIRSNEDYIETKDKKKPIHVKVHIPEDINIDKSYTVFFVDSKAKSVLKDNRIVYEQELVRGGDLFARSIYKAEGGESATAQSFFLPALESVYLVNNSKKTIKVKMLGYDVQQKWYANNGSISVDPMGNVSSSVISEGNDMESGKIDVKSGEKGWLSSIYVPTGKNIKDARLILEIDGKVVKTPPASSDATIEPGKYYIIIPKWDGENLEWNK